MYAPRSIDKVRKRIISLQCVTYLLLFVGYLYALAHDYTLEPLTPISPLILYILSSLCALTLFTASVSIFSWERPLYAIMGNVPGPGLFFVWMIFQGGYISHDQFSHSGITLFMFVQGIIQTVCLITWILYFIYIHICCFQDDPYVEGLLQVGIERR
ncbi:MAG: hypothetical protein Sylvanvirus2_7 [Sylvanvirus sp.]|uniref:Uncharacterized protein n=1 Tax=Sylvanvirus sp. TaxID=2487774 RepID=A0A3G5AJE9_9VIRU|nr:MAG: hypothetical protein Sylvanvirus2_7 [Sylvanvirus sp.]